MRRLVILLAAGLVVSACGETPRPATEPRVKLKLEAPNSGGTTRDDHISIHGTVTPADATVEVMGTAASVSAGEFTADVDLQPGGNVIDVTASSPGRRPAADALRYVRDMRVDVPNVLGRSPDDATAAVRATGLTPVIQDDTNWLDRLLGSPTVCSVSPPAGTAVAKGTKVTLRTANTC
ncbi:PASTA domain-containing protein [Solirubrobacter ginsenosidimutans]|uniref:PASTA domain-containing protein n=1 Tax=Solirubrobacter ginsenosidimutans TaxID=490573 RepID=A0A9X3S491_9ACTN|nr:PASTA domain-containing protein [Solirubrobacter ginsenosidimutans]MDA0164192.1 PASTA domain-containing protein [Solirubrobacter ginsenosidimutans]